jgi:hypothetical protein
MSFSVLRLSQQVGRLSLSGRGNGGDAAVRSVVATWRDRINNGKAILTTNNLQVSFSSLTLPSRPTAGTVLQGRINSMFMDSTTDYSKLFPGIPQHLIPTKALPILLKDRYKGLRPSVVRKRLEKMRTYSGKQKNIRGSPWKLNLVCQLAAGLPVWEVRLTLFIFLFISLIPSFFLSVFVICPHFFFISSISYIFKALKQLNFCNKAKVRDLIFS